MELLFSPCTRYRDLLYSRGCRGREDIRDYLELLDVSNEELLSAERAFTYADLHAMLENGTTVAWLSPHAAIGGEQWRASCYVRHNNFSFPYKFQLDVDGKIVDGMASSSEAFSEIIGVVRRLLLADVSEVYELQRLQSP
jgi:hypothetical protein